jgi:hypothetical protein
VRQDFSDDDDDGGGGDGGQGGGDCDCEGGRNCPRPRGGGGGGSASVDVAVWSGSADAHVSWSAGPLPAHPRQSGGTEVVIVYSSPLQTNGELLTDSNGRRLLRRRRDARPTWRLNVTEPVAGNFYPVTSLASLEEAGGDDGDGDGGEGGGGPPPALSSLSVVVDRAPSPLRRLPRRDRAAERDGLRLPWLRVRGAGRGGGPRRRRGEKGR